MIKEDEAIPADVVLICSSNAEGSCYIMTSSLDGEKNLKPKYSVKEVQDQLINKDKFDINGTLMYEESNSDLYSFNGVLK